MSRLRPAALGIDLGTTRIKAAVFDERGHEVAEASVPAPGARSGAGLSEQSMEEVRDRAFQCTALCVQEAAARGYGVAAVGVTGQGDGLWPVDGELRPVGPAMTWMDARAADIIEEWAAAGLLHRYRDMLGHAPFSGCQVALLAWLYRHRRPAFSAIRWALVAKDWIRLCLADFQAPPVTDVGTWRRTAAHLQHSEEGRRLARAMGLPDALPPNPEPVPWNRLAGFVGPEAARRTGLAEGTPIAVGVNDTVSTALGLGAVKEGDGVVIIGTTTFSGILQREDASDPGFQGSTYPAPGLALRGMGTLAGGPNLDWVRSLLAPGATPMDAAALDGLAAQAPPGAGGVLYFPFINPGGERAPFLDPFARAQFSGLSLEHGAPHLLRAALEGIALSSRSIFEALGGRLDRVLLGGGVSRLNTMARIVSSVLDRPVFRPEGSDFATRGAALAAGCAAGIYPTVHMPPATGDPIHPEPRDAALYDRLFDLYRKWIETQQPLWRALADVTASPGSHG